MKMDTLAPPRPTSCPDTEPPGSTDRSPFAAYLAELHDQGRGRRSPQRRWLRRACGVRLAGRPGNDGTGCSPATGKTRPSWAAGEVWPRGIATCRGVESEEVARCPDDRGTAPRSGRTVRPPRSARRGPAVMTSDRAGDRHRWDARGLGPGARSDDQVGLRTDEERRRSRIPAAGDGWLERPWGGEDGFPSPRPGRGGA